MQELNVITTIQSQYRQQNQLLCQDRNGQLSPPPSGFLIGYVHTNPKETINQCIELTLFLWPPPLFRDDCSSVIIKLSEESSFKDRSLTGWWVVWSSKRVGVLGFGKVVGVEVTIDLLCEPVLGAGDFCFFLAEADLNWHLADLLLILRVWGFLFGLESLSTFNHILDF